MKVGLVLEGGAYKGIFTSGVLDYWMEKNLMFPYVVSVSAGTCNALDYLSNQIARTKQCFMPDKGNEFVGFKRLVKTGHFLDWDRVFHEFPYHQYPFDGQTYLKSGIKNEIVVTNCRTGKPEYLVEQKDVDRVLRMGQASSSLPIFSEMVEIDGEKYLDGGMSDSIPVERALKVEGCDRVVVIMTHNEGYVPSISNGMKKIYRRKYRGYNEFYETLCRRPAMYESQIKKLKMYEKQGKALVIRPTKPAVNRFERDMNKMESFYQHGYQLGKEYYDKVIEFM